MRLLLLSCLFWCTYELVCCDVSASMSRCNHWYNSSNNDYNNFSLIPILFNIRLDTGVMCGLPECDACERISCNSEHCQNLIVDTDHREANTITTTTIPAQQFDPSICLAPSLCGHMHTLSLSLRLPLSLPPPFPHTHAHYHFSLTSQTT